MSDFRLGNFGPGVANDGFQPNNNPHTAPVRNINNNFPGQINFAQTNAQHGQLIGNHIGNQAHNQSIPTNNVTFGMGGNLSRNGDPNIFMNQNGNTNPNQNQNVGPPQTENIFISRHTLSSGSHGARKFHL
jgi:hypothetical protein